MSRTSKRRNLLDRYKSGQHSEVWSELRKYKVLSNDLREEAMEVALETMERVAHNADLIAKRLSKYDWEPFGGEFRVSPQPDDEKIFAEIEKRTKSPLPVSLEAFWRTVGGVNFIWNYLSPAIPPDLGPKLSMKEMDPLSIYAPREVKHALVEWDEQDPAEEGEDDYFQVVLAPDFYHKANVSGGDPYSIYVPFKGADPILEGEEHRLPFVDYLRLCFRLGGFSKLDEYENQAEVKKFVSKMTAGLEPF